MNIKAQQENIDRCRFCFMCRHVCTLGRVTNEEALTPRSQALGLSVILRDAMGYDEQLVENLYKCALCGYCKDWCQGGWDFPSSVKAARQDIVEAGLEPKVVSQLKDEIVKNKNAYNVAGINSELANEIASHTDKADTLLVFGSDVLYAAPEIGLSFIHILNKAGVKFTVLKDEDTTSYELYSLGYADEAKVKAKELVDNIKASGAKTVIVLSPDVESFLTDDLEKLGLSLEGIEVTGGVKIVHRLLKEEKVKAVKGYNKKVTYHDSNGLARETKVTEEPREILTGVPELEYNEMIWNKNEAHSTGSQLVNRLYPQVAGDILKKRVEDIEEIESDVVVTSCVYDKIMLKEICGSEKDVIDIYEMVAMVI